MDFTLISMLGFREEESHTPIPKPALIFNWTGTTKMLFALHICREQQKQTFGKTYEILFCWRCDIPIGHLLFSLGHFLWIICPLSTDISFFQWSSDSLVWMPSFSEKDKNKTLPNPNFGGFSFGKLYLIK